MKCYMKMKKYKKNGTHLKEIQKICWSELAACVEVCSEFEKTLEESLKGISLTASFATVGGY